ncbi:hypothetical protein Syun_026179 [Stephania yunnanensis]|uniref:Uncharacterized protein n=1 Tax=Stephania yunnanensis TaxID=152371 RepID=A0AAP0HW26_9MAGN
MEADSVEMTQNYMKVSTDSFSFGQSAGTGVQVTWHDLVTYPAMWRCPSTLCLSPQNLSSKPLNCCSVYLRLGPLPSLRVVIASAGGRAICRRGLRSCAFCRRYLQSHRRLPSPSNAAACATLADVRRYSSLPLKPSPFAFALYRRCLCNPHRCSPLFVTASLKRTYKVWNTSLEWPRAGIGYELRAFELNNILILHTTPDQPVDDEAVYYNVASECPKGRVYGLGSLGRKKRIYVDPDASTSRLPKMVPRSEFDSVTEQLRQVVAFMHRQFGMTIDGAGLSQPHPQPQPPPAPHEQQKMKCLGHGLSLDAYVYIFMKMASFSIADGNLAADITDEGGDSPATTVVETEGMPPSNSMKGKRGVNQPPPKKLAALPLVIKGLRPGSLMFGTRWAPSDIMPEGGEGNEEEQSSPFLFQRGGAERYFPSSLGARCPIGPD